MHSFLAKVATLAFMFGHPFVVNAQNVCTSIVNDHERLKCFDEQAPSLAECKIKNWGFKMRGTSIVTMQGETSCESGRLDYSLFDPDGSLLDVGFHYFSGFIFEAYPEISLPVPEGVLIEYTITR